MRSLRGIGIVLLSLCGCNAPDPAPPPNPFTTASDAPSRARRPADRTELRRELEMHRARWWKEQPLAYQLTVSKLCFCDTGVPWISRIEDFRVISSSGGYDRNGENIGPPLRSVEQLFREADRAVHSNAEEVSVTFDPRFSYPTRITIDDLRSRVDDELEWIAELTVLR